MATGIKVTGAAVVLPTIDGKEQYLYRSGAVIPAAGFTPVGVARGVELGLVEIVETPAAEEVLTAEVVEISAPDASWTHEQIDAFAAQWEITIPVDGKKDEKLAAITAEIEKRTAEHLAG